eukprot:NODE_17320_length_192_cov_3.552448_g16406_i0.p2 GENE.NODE_17320_length_192_cov_3.552448_g16406_i0~~NODE_17320_length_192_cov_3.552448_g16406_i0.p2  ORF type:complete len:56 (+),score=12.93 NODE_17320_length_192_cov_3.552448_g16406_i0:24-170(+)
MGALLPFVPVLVLILMSLPFPSPLFPPPLLSETDSSLIGLSVWPFLGD